MKISIVGMMVAVITISSATSKAEDPTYCQVVSKITDVKLYVDNDDSGKLQNIIVTVSGEVPYLGATEASLITTSDGVPPKDGIRDFYLTAKTPNQYFTTIPTPVSAGKLCSADYWLKGVRIHGASDNVKVVMLKDALSANVARKTLFRRAETDPVDTTEKK